MLLSTSWWVRRRLSAGCPCSAAALLRKTFFACKTVSDWFSALGVRSSTPVTLFRPFSPPLFRCVLLASDLLEGIAASRDPRGRYLSGRSWPGPTPPPPLPSLLFGATKFPVFTPQKNHIFPSKRCWWVNESVVRLLKIPTKRTQPTFCLIHGLCGLSFVSTLTLLASWWQ